MASEFKEKVRLIEQTVKRAETNVSSINQLLQEIFKYFGEIDVKIETLKTLAIRKDLFTDSEHEDVWNEIKGIRYLAPDEIMKVGDHGLITIEGKWKGNGEVLIKEEKFPVTLGLGFLDIDKYIIGKNAGHGQFEFEKTYPNEYDNKKLSGKTIEYNVLIEKVKTKCKKN